MPSFKMRLMKEEIFESELTDHVETTHVPVELHILLVDFNVVVGVDTVWSHQETINSRLRVHLLEHIENSHDYVVSTCGLTPTEYESDLD
jgi:hypothetical protein